MLMEYNLALCLAEERQKQGSLSEEYRDKKRKLHMCFVHIEKAV